MDLAEATKEDTWQDKISPNLLQEKHHWEPRKKSWKSCQYKIIIQKDLFLTRGQSDFLWYI